MTACSAVISRAFRMARIVGVGDEPTASEADEGLSVLQSVYARIADAPRLTERYETSAVTAEENERIYSSSTVTLPPTVTDDDTGELRRPRDLAVVHYRDSTTASLWRTYLSDRGDWVRIDSLAETDTAPLADRNLEGLCALVAIELAETFGKEVSGDTRGKAARFQAQCWPKRTETNEYF